MPYELLMVAKTPQWWSVPYVTGLYKHGPQQLSLYKAADLPTQFKTLPQTRADRILWNLIVDKPSPITVALANASQALNLVDIEQLELTRDHLVHNLIHKLLVMSEETQISKRLVKDKDKLPYPDNCSIKVPPETKLKDFAKNDWSNAVEFKIKNSLPVKDTQLDSRIVIKLPIINNPS